MRKNIEPAARCIEFIQRISIEWIEPFNEKPSKEREIKGKTKEVNDLGTSEIYSLVTTDIINEKVLL